MAAHAPGRVPHSVIGNPPYSAPGRNTAPNTDANVPRPAATNPTNPRNFRYPAEP